MLYLLKKNLKKFAKDKDYRNVRDHCHHTGRQRSAGYSVYNLKINVPIEILIVFRNSSNYGYHFIIKELANEFEGQLESLERGKLKTFSVLIKK